MRDDSTHEIAPRYERAVQHPDEIPGWGVDADPMNDPTYPMRDRRQDDSPGRNWEPPSFQETDVEILQSIEHVRRPAVFGTSTPPRGVSGAIRRVAFAYSESQWARWLLLILADRINVVEGVVQDLSRGRAPNLVRERGMKAAWAYDRNGSVRRLATSVAVVGASAGIAYLLLKKGRPAARG